MRKLFQVISAIVVVACVMVLFFPKIISFVRVIPVFWSFDHLEQNARKVITGGELQTWATNFLAAHNSNMIWNSAAHLDTNFPRQLLGLYRNPPAVITYEAVTNENGGVNDPAYLKIDWGGAIIGSSGFYVGPTNFLGFGGHEWQPGVYFYKR